MTMLLLVLACTGRQEQPQPEAPAPPDECAGAGAPFDQAGSWTEVGCTQAEAAEALGRKVARIACTGTNDPTCSGDPCDIEPDALGQFPDGAGERICSLHLAAHADNDYACRPTTVSECPPPPTNPEDPEGSAFNGWSCTTTRVTGSCSCTCKGRLEGPGSVTGGAATASTEADAGTCRPVRGAQPFQLDGRLSGYGCSRELAAADLQGALLHFGCTGPSDPVCGGACDDGEACGPKLDGVSWREEPLCWRARVSWCDGNPTDTDDPGSIPAAPSPPAPDAPPDPPETCASTREVPGFSMQGRIVEVACTEGEAMQQINDKIERLACSGGSDPRCDGSCNEGQCAIDVNVSDGVYGCWDTTMEGCPNGAKVCQAIDITGACGCTCASQPDLVVPPAPASTPAPPDPDPPSPVDTSLNGWVCTGVGVTGTCGCACD